MERPASGRRWWFLSGGILGMLLAIFVVGFVVAAQRRQSAPPVSRVRVLGEFPHDARAFTQGLVVSDGHLYEGTGKKGESSLRRVDLKTGRVERIVPMDPAYFGEGITVFQDRIFQITWQDRIAFVYDLKTMRQIKTHRYADEGWGLTHDGKNLIMSDGTSLLRFLDPETFEVVRRVRVRGPQGPIDKLNELEYVKGEVLANIWYSDRIVRISPESGEVLGWIDLGGAFPDRMRRNREEVLNGIAYDSTEDRLFVTGKNWPRLYEIEIVAP